MNQRLARRYAARDAYVIYGIIGPRGPTLDAATKKRLILGFLTNWVSRFVSTIIQLVQVPIFFHFWSTNVYGDWLIVNALPSYLAFSSIGFGSVASNEMTMLNSAGDREGALRVFQSCWWLVTLVCSAVGLLLVPVLLVVPLGSLINVHSISESDTKHIVFYLGISVLLGQLEQLMGAAYTCVARYSLGVLIKSILTFLAFAAMIVPVVLGYGPRTTALVFAVANCLGTVVFAFLMRRNLPWIKFGWRYARFSEIRRLAPLAVAFMGFPIGNALNLQGTLMAIQYALGPVEVAIFASARTVSRVALQMVQMINTTFWPEVSLAYGASNIDTIRILHRRACQMAGIFAVIVALGMMTFGPWFLTHWTGGHVPPSRPLLAILLLVVIIYALWSTSSLLPSATNQHQRLAAWYITATTITVVLTFFMARWKGLYGAAASLVLSEIIMNIYVLPNSLRLARDTFPAFMASMLQYPPSLKPGALVARLRRSRPELEAE
ncbi:MAG TPA: lipopolysaccharide biosynthesis protein [Acidobacteriaceae bacterium]|nr:lipopolysaccharide biosynthesis protein [Acidobacteriaceae bacterium]